MTNKKDTMKMKGLISIEVKDKEGKLKEKRDVTNTITNVSLAEVTGLMGNVGSKTAFTYLAVGVGTTAAAAGDTTLETEITDSGLARSAATVSQETTTQTDDTLQLLKAWTASGTKAITECGILNAASTGTLLGRQVFAALNVISSDVITLRYQVVQA